MKVVCFGDSNTYGYDPRGYFGGRYDPMYRWVDVLGKKTGWTVVDEGQNGREIPGNPMVLPEHADLLIVMLGTNDLLQGGTIPTIVAHMERFLSAIEPAKVVLIAPPPMTTGEWVPTRQLVEDSILLAQGYEVLAQKLGVGFANAGEWKVSLAYDGVHFTEAGHIAFAEGLYKELTK